MLVGNNYRVADAAFEVLELLAGKLAWAVLRGLGAGDSPRLLGTNLWKIDFTMQCMAKARSSKDSITIRNMEICVFEEINGR